MSVRQDQPAPSHACRIGIDVGGTFTDFVLVDRLSGEMTRYKEPSVPEDPSRSIETGLPRLLELAGRRPEDVELIMHGTTLIVNAIIQRRGARVGLVVTKGHRGLLEIGRGKLPSTYNLRVSKEEPLVPRDRVLEVSARHDASGRVLSRPDAEELDALAARFRDQQVDAVAIMLPHSHAFPELEQEVAQGLAARLPGVPVSASAQIWPEQREYERALVAIMNAYVSPIMNSYLDRLTDRLERIGIAGAVFMTTSNGGTISIDSARCRPIDTALSGPSQGVVAAARAGEGRDRILSVDMGGTSADVAVTIRQQPEYTTMTHIGGLPLVLPVVSVSAIGAGGGSIVWVDAQGVLKVGPDSAGAAPGPICYGRGGTAPTITDCYLTLGYIDPAQFLGGRMALDRAGARAALAALAERLGLDGEDRAEQVAEAAIRVATAMMATELQKTLAERGLDMEGFTLMSFGGAGAMHGALLAQEAGIAELVVPPAPATFCALGAVLADVKRDYVRSVRVTLSPGSGASQALRDSFAEIETEGRDWIASEGGLIGQPELLASCDMRYAGQSFVLPVALDEGLREAPDADALIEMFHQVHERSYGFRDTDSGIEVVAQRMQVVGRIPPLPLPQVAPGGGAAGLAPTRRVYLGGAHTDVPVHRREDLTPVSAIAGPAIIEQGDCTVWVVPDTSVGIDAVGNIVITATPATDPEQRRPLDAAAL